MQVGIQLKAEVKVGLDIAMFQRFVNAELTELIKNFKKLTNLETLSLFEIFQENE